MDLFNTQHRWTRKPPPGTGLDINHPYCPDHCWPFLSSSNVVHCLTRSFHIATPNQTIWAGSQTMVPGRKYGLSVRHGANTDHLNLADTPAVVDSIVGFGGGFTVLICYRKTDGTARAATAFGVDGALSGADCCLLLLPYSTGDAYWRYAASGANDVVCSGLTYGDDLWVATTGTRGMELWQNGLLRGSNSANPTRITAGSYLGCPAGTPNWADLSDTALIMTWRRQLTRSAIRDLSVNPWQVFEPIRWPMELTAGSPPPPTDFAALTLAP
jgi:hypothetical protein